MLYTCIYLSLLHVYVYVYICVYVCIYIYIYYIYYYHYHIIAPAFVRRATQPSDKGYSGACHCAWEQVAADRVQWACWVPGTTPLACALLFACVCASEEMDDCMHADVSILCLGSAFVARSRSRPWYGMCTGVFSSAHLRLPMCSQHRKPCRSLLRKTCALQEGHKRGNKPEGTIKQGWREGDRARGFRSRCRPRPWRRLRSMSYIIYHIYLSIYLSIHVSI